MDILDLVDILFKNHSGDDSDYDFFISLIKHIMKEPQTAKDQTDEANGKYNPFDVGWVQQATVIRCIRRQPNHQLDKRKMQKVRKYFDIDRFATYIKDTFTEQDLFNIEAEIKNTIPDFNEQEDDICYPCAYLMLNLIDEYVGSKGSASNQIEAEGAEPQQTNHSFLQQPVIFNFIQNGDHNTQIAHVEHYHADDKED